MSAAESHILPVYSPPEQNFVRGEGCWIWDDKGDKYLDCIAGISVNALGHAPPVLVKALTEQAGKLWHTSNMFKVKGQEELAAKYTRDSFADVVFFTNSGTEAIEGSLKTARKYHTANGQSRAHRHHRLPRLVPRPLVRGDQRVRQSELSRRLRPAPAGLHPSAVRRFRALKKLVGPTTAAVIIEPVQGEGGVRAVPDEYLRGLRKLADETGFLIIFDEVQSGAGRTGKMWAHQWSGVTPDIMAVAKGVGGGFPMGAFMATKEAAKGMVVGVHGTTFGGNPLAMAVGNAVL
jgi:acetylornithine/N-succinyldiaminopimelate aminotransferase